jgi:hypothetical protein
VAVAVAVAAPSQPEEAAVAQRQPVAALVPEAAAQPRPVAVAVAVAQRTPVVAWAPQVVAVPIQLVAAAAWPRPARVVVAAVRSPPAQVALQ